MTRIAAVIRKPTLKTAYARGATFERYVMAQLCKWERGSIVIRSAGSHSPIDLVWCSKGQGPVGVQCKLTALALSLRQRLALFQWCRDAGVTPALATKARGGWSFEFVRADGSLAPWVVP